MAVKVLVPTTLQTFTNEPVVECADVGSVDQLIQTLETDYPGIKSRLCDEAGKIRRFVNFYVNEEDIRFLQGQGTELKDGDEVSIVPAVAGG